MSGNQKSHWATSPATYTVRPAGSGGRYAGRNSATRPPNVRIPNGQPTRSAITVAGIVGTALNNSRIRGSNPSTRDPAGVRSYLGGPSLANAAFTVFREQPITRAISEIETPSERRSLRISAQSSTISTRSLPRSTPARVSGKLVKFQLPHRGQFSAAADTLSGDHGAGVSDEPTMTMPDDGACCGRIWVAEPVSVRMATTGSR